MVLARGAGDGGAAAHLRGPANLLSLVTDPNSDPDSDSDSDDGRVTEVAS